MTTAYRDDNGEALRRENERLARELAEAKAKPPMTWQVIRDGQSPREWCVGAALLSAIVALAGLVDAGLYVWQGHAPVVVRLAQVTAGAAVLWCLAFIRRVPR